MNKRLFIWLSIIAVLVFTIIIRVQFVIAERNAVKVTSTLVRKEKGIPVDVYKLRKTDFVFNKTIGSKRIKGNLFRAMVTSDLKERIKGGAKAFFPKAKVPAVVRNVSNEIDFSTGLFAIDIESQRQIASKGKIFPVRIELTRKRNQLLIPNSAILGRSVWVVKDGKSHMVRTDLGDTNGSHTIVRKGLELGDEVIVHGKAGLVEGTKVFIGEQL